MHTKSCHAIDAIDIWDKPYEFPNLSFKRMNGWIFDSAHFLRMCRPHGLSEVIPIFHSNANLGGEKGSRDEEFNV